MPKTAFPPNPRRQLTISAVLIGACLLLGGCQGQDPDLMSRGDLHEALHAPLQSKDIASVLAYLGQPDDFLYFGIAPTGESWEAARARFAGERQLADAAIMEYLAARRPGSYVFLYDRGFTHNFFGAKDKLLNVHLTIEDASRAEEDLLVLTFRRDW